MNDYQCVSDDVILGEEVFLSKFINLYGCKVGDRSRIGAFVEIQKGAKIGCDCKISSHSFICEGVTIMDRVFVGHNVIFTNDKSCNIALIIHFNINVITFSCYKI